ncbi:MAG TPA: hypothetical protein VI855_06945 [Dehalococcoidia bacterium]|nr:hypothetical protein [Dehalococcoidia bacterium]
MKNPTRRLSVAQRLQTIEELLEDLAPLVAKLDHLDQAVGLLLLRHVNSTAMATLPAELLWRIQAGKIPCPTCGTLFRDHQEGAQP